MSENTILINNIREGKIDLNNQSSFFSTLIKGLLWDLNKRIKLRDKSIPHYITNTGDETIFTNIKGSDETADPINIENENYIYTKIPRCIITPKGITLEEDQCTSPYSLGTCQYEDKDTLVLLTGEFRRLSLTMAFDLEYLTDSYSDYLSLCQQIVSRMAFIQTFDISYMGQKIPCSYKIPTSFEGEYAVDFDLNSTEDKRKKLSLSIDVDTVFPVFDNKTIIASDNYIKHVYVHGSPSSATAEQLDPADESSMFSSNMTVYYPGGSCGEDVNK